ncbi:MAG: hypothetical protein QOF30_3049 [Acidimicrobiaceae bacterium]|nr:hypothetical protein [Acidimicrobiaceae bacterium]
MATKRSARMSAKLTQQIGQKLSYSQGHHLLMTRSDPRTLLHRSFAQAGRVVAGVSPEQLRLPTPCTDFDVTALLGHLVGVGHRIAGIGRGEPQTGKLSIPVDVADDGWGRAFEATRQDAWALWADDAVLERKVELPFGTFTGATVAAIYTMELTAHTWDLAWATGQLEALDDELAEASMTVAADVLPPDQRGGYIPFADVVAVSGTAAPYDRLAAFLGRQIA